GELAQTSRRCLRPPPRWYPRQQGAADPVAPLDGGVVEGVEVLDVAGRESDRRRHHRIEQLLARPERPPVAGGDLVRAARAVVVGGVGAEEMDPEEERPLRRHAARPFERPADVLAILA